ncbi:peptidyl-tRNA hydrolase [Candidozyma haemuli]|uniref:peptidyl-tRNA hydrolase n=1 Tax=Candidozyma haemuli TaxID=45357 RepID=A0A2V1ATG8_9ASCO|nr:peptidyl-tRNA hydrolase [[Candida] haemuloni]PVH21380.1 peptidyl-tRNA hydrolase [[Candida] haemuloni]
MAQTVGLLTLFRKVRPSKPPSSDSDASTESYSDSDSEDDIEIDSRPLNEIPGEVRMTLIVRSDLKMGKGKAAAQCSHATLALYKRMADASKGSYNPTLLQRWERGNGQAKITLQVPNQEDMDVMFAQALSLGVNAYIVHDAGRTQIAAGSATVLGLGPAPKLVMDQITSDLKLY